jgi:hypothetical protein
MRIVQRSFSEEWQQFTPLGTSTCRTGREGFDPTGRRAISSPLQMMSKS